MNSRKLTKYVVLIFTILLADVVKEIVMHYIGIRKDPGNPYVSAAFGMLVIVAVFYPLFLIMEKGLEKVTEGYVSKTKKATGGSYKGLLIAFALGLLALYIAYLKVWFNVNPFK